MKKKWNKTFEELEIFIKETGKKPTASANRRLYDWIRRNTTGRYKNSDRARKITLLFELNGLNSDNRKNKFELTDEFNTCLRELNNFLKETGKKPTIKTDKKLNAWIKENTTGCYKNSKRAKKITKAIKKYWLTGRVLENWNETFEELESFIKETGKKPTQESNKKLVNWVRYNTTDLYNGSKRAKKITKAIKKYVLTGKALEDWNETFEELKCYVIEIGKKPTIKTNKKLNAWINKNTKGCYKNSQRSNKIKNLFDQYVLNLNPQKIWKVKYQELESVIKETGEKPTIQSNPQLTEWISHNMEGIRQYTKEARMINDLFEKHGLK